MQGHAASLRREYTKAELNKKSVKPDPFEQFNLWFEEAMNSEVTEPNAMVVATVNTHGVPSQRTVLLKDAGQNGFTFYTNYTSKKGEELAQNHHISLLFPWYELERQVIIIGKAEKISRKNSKQYFHLRPRESQLGAWVSNQSSRIEGRIVLERRQEELKKKFEGKEIPIPDNWGGYLVVPISFEFWKGRSSRLHDRILFEQVENGWKISRLSP